MNIPDKLVRVFEKAAWPSMPIRDDNDQALEKWRRGLAAVFAHIVEDEAAVKRAASAWYRSWFGPFSDFDKSDIKDKWIAEHKTALRAAFAFPEPEPDVTVSDAEKNAAFDKWKEWKGGDVREFLGTVIEAAKRAARERKS